MSGEEIREKIKSNNERIDEILSTVTFTLNKEVVALRAENKRLQSVCNHRFDELGRCIFCDEEK